MNQFYRCLVLLAALAVWPAAAGAANVNGNGVSLNLPTTDLFSGTAQANGAGARVVAAGTPIKGVVSANANGARIIVEPMSHLSAGAGEPAVDFAATPLSGLAPLEVQFTSMASGVYPVLIWQWDFGDGSLPSNEQNPMHVYTETGTYTVILTITTAVGEISEIKQDYITVAEAVPATDWAGLLLMTAVVAILGNLAARRPAATDRR